MYKFLTFSVFFSIAFGCFSQSEFQKGFNMLESGNFKEAKLFFEEKLKTHPTHKTVKICYGRGLGLSGGAKESVVWFENLNKEFPNDLEVLLNYAESYMWVQDFEKGKNQYLNILKTYPTNFVANLGLANALSNLKNYKESKSQIEKTLALDPKNASALVSQKYILMGYGYQLSQNRDFDNSEIILKDALLKYSNDLDLIKTLSNIYIAQKKYNENYSLIQSLKGNEDTDLEKLVLLSLNSYLLKKNKESLEYSSSAYANSYSIESNSLKKSIHSRFIEANIWNKNIPTASVSLVQHFTIFKDSIEYYRLLANIENAKGNEKGAISAYSNLLNLNSESYDGILGITNSYFSNQNYKSAFQWAERAANVFPNSLDAKGIKERISFSLAPVIDFKAFGSKDLGKDEALDFRVNAKIPLSYKFGLLANGVSRNTNNDLLLTSGKLIQGDIGFYYKLSPEFQTSIGVRALGINIDSLSKSHIMVFLNNKLRLSPFHTFDFGFYQELQDFNTALMRRNIRTDHYYTNYYLNTNIGLGFFGQLFHSRFSDQNFRNLLFTSLYYNIFNDPNLKTGINYQYITFNEKKPLDYFSPSQYHLVEGFFGFSSVDNFYISNQFLWNIIAAVGYQKVEENNLQLTYRIIAEAGYKLHNQIKLLIYGMHNNISSATAAGFTYTEFGLKMNYTFKNKLF